MVTVVIGVVTVTVVLTGTVAVTVAIGVEAVTVAGTVGTCSSGTETVGTGSNGDDKVAGAAVAPAAGACVGWGAVRALAAASAVVAP